MVTGLAAGVGDHAVKVKVPPGSGRLRGLAVLSTRDRGRHVDQADGGVVGVGGGRAVDVGAGDGDDVGLAGAADAGEGPVNAQA